MEHGSESAKDYLRTYNGSRNWNMPTTASEQGQYTKPEPAGQGKNENINLSPEGVAINSDVNAARNFRDNNQNS